MALSILEKQTISELCNLARRFTDEISPKLDRLNVTYDAANGVKTSITQAELDEDASLSGLTKAQLDDGAFALTSTLRTAINNAYSQLVIIAEKA